MHTKKAKMIIPRNLPINEKTSSTTCVSDISEERERVQQRELK